MLDVTRAYGLTFHFPGRDTAVGASLAAHGEFARAELDLMSDIARASRRGTLVDVGANIGALALPFAHRFSDWRVLAVEAHRGLSTVLAANAVCNGLGNVEVVNAAAAAAPGLLDFPCTPLSGAGNFGLMAVGMNAPVEQVRALALDEVAPPDTRLVKIDVEGFEPEVLKGAARLLRDVRPAWIFEVSPRRPEVTASCLGTFLEAGYLLHWFYTPFVLPKPLKGDAPFERARGDLNVLAADQGAFGWDLLPVTSAHAPLPTYGEGLRYLRRYG